jgi:two-component system, NtrC family, response regulator HydG
MVSTQTILVVEDQIRERDALCRVLRAEGFNAVGTSNVDAATQCLGEPIDLLICDVRLGQESGLEVLKEWKRRQPAVPVIMVTAYGEVATAVAAMKSGAIDYLTKPIKPDELLMLLNRYLPMQHRSDVSLGIDTSGLGRMIGQSVIMRSVFKQIEAIANSDTNVLITGESGTGKELVASAIHEHSRRRALPYASVNIAALPEALVGPEIFGYLKGSFAYASENRAGRLSAAQDGTLYIDEIGDFPLALQPKLLRVMEAFRFSPMGCEKELASNVRIIASTSRNLREQVANNTFREDLFNKLSQCTIRIPALRERPDDIPYLIQHFVSDCARRHLREPPVIDAVLSQFLCAYEWPGNVRQLRNAIENMLVLGRRDVLTMEDLTAFLSGNPTVATDRPPPADLSLSELERVAVIGALERAMGNKTHAAQKLGISVRTLQRKMKQWMLEGCDSEE